MLISAIRLIFFLLSFIGYVFYAEKRTKIQVEFLPIISIAFIISVLFFGGILNILYLTTILLFILGLLLFAKEIYENVMQKRIRENISKYITPGIIIFGISIIYFVLTLKEQRLYHYDNFSHWALMVKNIVFYNRLPNFENLTIAFNSYPPGSALFIYYFMKITGISEGRAIIGQMFIILSSLLTLFSFTSYPLISSEKQNKSNFKNISMNVAVTLVSLYLLNGPSSIRNLLVDTLLIVIGVALFALIYFYMYSPHKIYIPIALLGIVLTLVKNSGLFFVLFSLAIYSYSLILYNKREENSFLLFIKKESKLLIPFFSPLVVNYLWNNHVSMVFSSDRIGKHTMSLTNYIATYNEKDSELISEITQNFVTTIYNNYFSEILVILSIILLFLIYSVIINKTIDKRLLIIGITSVTTFILYCLGLWLMYLVSMPIGEALILAGYGRYMGTIMNYIMGITVVSLIYYLKKSVISKATSVLIILVCLFFGYLTFSPNSILDTKSLFENTEIEIGIDQPTLKNIDIGLSHISQNPMLSYVKDDKYLVYYPSSMATDYEKWYLNYRLLNNNNTFTDYIDEEIVWGFDYLLVTFVTEEITEFFNKYSESTPEIGTYKIDKEHQIILEKQN